MSGESCRQCRIGSTSSAGSSSCTTCPAGRYVDSKGSCEACPAGQFSNNDGQTSCQQCTPGSFASAPGRTSCTHCPAGSIADVSGSAACTPCPAGQEPNTDRTACTMIPSGKISSRKRSIPWCDVGHKACKIPMSKGLYECVAISSDIESCGGCIGEGEGVDCTAFDEKASASCVQGKCVYQCPKDFILTARGCERKALPPRSRSKRVASWRRNER